MKDISDVCCASCGYKASIAPFFPSKSLICPRCGLLYRDFTLTDFKSIEEVLQAERRLSCRDTVRLTVSAGKVLNDAHAHHLVHAHIRPDLVFLDQTGLCTIEADVVPFTLDMVTAHDPTFLDISHLRYVDYLAPEQLMPPYVMSRQLDIYALGMLMFNVLCGSLPLSKHNSLSSKLIALSAGEVLKISDFRADIPSGLSEACNRAISHDRFKRYGNLTEMISILESIEIVD